MSTNPEERFEFGENWRAFLSLLDEERIEQAVRSLCEKLDVQTLSGMRFLDLGCGSGLFSLAAHRLGADVVSVDFDPACVACTLQLSERFGGADVAWKIEQGSALDAAYLESHGVFDVVYSWGVLHHTGNMVRALDLATMRVANGGTLMIALYNDQGSASRRWHSIKRIYNRLPRGGRPFWVVLIAGYYEVKFALSRLLRGKNPSPLGDWHAKKQDRGMSAWHDWVDWVGGLPFEVAKPDDIIEKLADSGFAIKRLSTVGSGWGCNEYVFRHQGVGHRSGQLNENRRD